MTDAPSIPVAPEEHEHVWQPNGTVNVDQVSHSPVSTWDDVLYTDVLAMQSCSCGELRKTRVGRNNVRTRHEQHWRDKGGSR